MRNRTDVSANTVRIDLTLLEEVVTIAAYRSRVEVERELDNLQHLAMEKSDGTNRVARAMGAERLSKAADQLARAMEAQTALEYYRDGRTTLDLQVDK